MKIIYIANIRLPTEKAHGIQIMEVCSAFAEQGYEVELIVPNRKTVVNGEIREDNAFDYYDIRPNFQITKLRSIDLVKFGRIGFIVQSISFGLHAAIAFLFKKGIFYTRDEIIAVFLRIQGKKVTWEAHMGHHNFLTWLIVRMKIPIVVITDHLKKFYIKMGVADRNILISPDGVDLKKFNPSFSKIEARRKLGLKEDERIVLYTGHLYSWKGADTLARSCGLIRHEVKIIFVGGTEKHVVQFKERYRDVEKIKVLGQLPHNIIPTYLRSADILVLPNSGKEDISKFYTSPLKLFEYMASGTPIVASKLPSIMEIVSDSEVSFFEPDNPNSLATVIDKVLGEYNKAISKAVFSSEKVKNFSWQRRAERIIEFLVA